MVKTGNECQLSAYMLLFGKYAITVCCAEVPSFLPVVGTWHAEWSTERTTETDIVQTERVLTRLVGTASMDSRLHWSSKRVSPQHPCIECVPSCVVLACVARTTLGGSWVHTSRTKRMNCSSRFFRRCSACRAAGKMEERKRKQEKKEKKENQREEKQHKEKIEKRRETR